MNTKEEETFERSIFSSGNYEILYDDYPYIDPQTDDVANGKTPSYINGANVCQSNLLECSIYRNPKSGEVHRISFKMPVDDAKLSSVFNMLPWGLIKKNRTGVGATTLELKSRRNSIIVVPTRALAYDKFLKSKISASDKYSTYYVGSKIENHKPIELESYLADSEIPYKKFLVVSDSLPQLLEKLGDTVYSDYFLMVDEIDSYQYDNWYRPNMERVIDCYFKFPYSQRCLVSATIGSFSDDRINKEPLLDIEFNRENPRDIICYPTKNITAAVSNVAKQLADNHPNDIIIIAFNSVVHGILPIIKSLSDELKSQCGVLCGVKSKKHVEEYYLDDVDNMSGKRIIFMTCSYFVGIDINERFHLISVADVFHPYSLLSTDKLQQIAGRCRNSEGLLSERIIYNYKPLSTNNEIDFELLKKQIIHDAELLVRVNNDIESAKIVFPNLVRTFNQITMDDIILASRKTYYSSGIVPLVRITDNRLLPSYFNIDNLLIQINLLNAMYVDERKLFYQLCMEGNNCRIDFSENNNAPLSEDITSEIQLEIATNVEEERAAIIAELRGVSDISQMKIVAMARRNSALNRNGVFLDRLIELIDYVPFVELIPLLQSHDTKSQYKHLYNAILFWSLAPNHAIRIALNGYFTIGQSYDNHYIANAINSIWNGILGLGNLTEKQAMIYAKLYFISIKRKSVRDRDSATPAKKYVVESTNALGLSINPSSVISNQENIKARVKL